MKHRVFLALIALESAALVALALSGAAAVRAGREEVREKRETVTRLMLTDLALWTEARYTRNPSQADFFSPFQDSPSSIDHFPAGSILAPSRTGTLPRPNAR